MENVYCICCGEKRPYKVLITGEANTVRGITFSYVVYTAFCTECGEEVYVSEINDFNVQSLEEACRGAWHLITIGKVKEILQKSRTEDYLKPLKKSIT